MSMLGVISICASSSELDDRNRSLEAGQIAIWEDCLTSVQKKSQEEKLLALFPGLRTMSFWSEVEGHRYESEIVFNRIRQEVLAIPGHAEFYSDKIERERAKIELGDCRGGYDLHRTMIFETLKSLPSAETVKVLGEFLIDERDTPPPRYPGQDYSNDPANCHLAARALFKLGLRDVPMGGDHRPIDQTLNDYRVWWEELRTGRKTFSFKGQNVEYRFKPDGTWDTLPIANPSEDDVKPPKPSSKPAAEKSPDQAIQPAKSDDTRQWLVWLWIPAVVFMAGAWRIFSRRRVA